MKTAADVLKLPVVIAIALLTVLITNCDSALAAATIEHFSRHLTVVTIHIKVYL